MKKEIPQEDWVNPKIETQETAGKGKGMFAVSPIETGEKILVWGGKDAYVNRMEADKARSEGRHVMQWDDDLFSVEDRGADASYFINHSCDSNTWMIDTFTLAAKKDIQPGEEVTVDYALLETDEDYRSKWTCKCGTPLCRGTITGRDWKLPEVQKRYKDHFLPFINRRIAKL